MKKKSGTYIAEKKVSNWRFLLLRLLSSRKQLIWASVAIGIDALLTLCRPWPLKVVIDRVILHSSKVTRVPFIGEWLSKTAIDPNIILIVACLAVLIIAMGTGFFTYSFTRTMGNVGRQLVFDLRSDLFAHIQKLSMRFHDKQRTGDLMTRMTSDMQSIQDILSNGVVTLLSNLFLLVGMATLMFWLNWKFALVALSMSPFLFWSVFRSTQYIKKATREARTSDGLLASLTQETFSSIRIVQGLAQEEQQNERFQIQNQASLKAYLDGLIHQARIAPLVDFLAAAGLALVMWYGARGVMAGSITTGDVVVFFAYVTNLYSPMKALSKLAYSFNRASIGLERISEILSERSEVADAKDAIKAPQLKGYIEFKNVSFKYEKEKTILSKINLSIAPGETVALVGVSGDGKSTLASLIPRFYDPYEGKICIDGQDIRNFKLKSLRDQISLVLQDSLLFKGTIRENIAYGRPEATLEEVVAASVIAHADEFINNSPEGYETMVMERGANLSGGQKQRIAIARAILRNTPILILDEPTSGLDVISEDLVISALERASKGRTTLIISHRLTTLHFVDRIIVMREGKIVAEGTHEELSKKNYHYARLWYLSSRNFESC